MGLFLLCVIVAISNCSYLSLPVSVFAYESNCRYSVDVLLNHFTYSLALTLQLEPDYIAAASQVEMAKSPSDYWRPSPKAKASTLIVELSIVERNANTSYSYFKDLQIDQRSSEKLYLQTDLGAVKRAVLPEKQEGRISIGMRQKGVSLLGQFKQGFNSSFFADNIVALYTEGDKGALHLGGYDSSLFADDQIINVTLKNVGNSLGITCKKVNIRVKEENIAEINSYSDGLLSLQSRDVVFPEQFETALLKGIRRKNMFCQFVEHTDLNNEQKYMHLVCRGVDQDGIDKISVVLTLIDVAGREFTVELNLMDSLIQYTDGNYNFGWRLGLSLQIGDILLKKYYLVFQNVQSDNNLGITGNLLIGRKKIIHKFWNWWFLTKLAGLACFLFIAYALIIAFLDSTGEGKITKIKFEHGKVHFEKYQNANHQLSEDGNRTLSHGENVASVNSAQDKE